MSIHHSTTYARATLAYDTEHERALLDAITQAIVTKSKVSDCNAVVIRTGEAAQALLTALACVLAMSPSATLSPSALRKTCDDFSKSLRRKVGAAEQNSDLQEFMRRTFSDSDAEGNA